MPRRHSTIQQSWPAGSAQAAIAGTPRSDVLDEEHDGDGRFSQERGPFRHYQRRLEHAADGTVTETITYRLEIPWFGRLFFLPMRRALRHRRPEGAASPWWAPPDRLSERQVVTLALLAAASAAATFANTLFTQTANFAAESFGITNSGQSVGGAVVRLGVVIALPFAIVADRIGRRRTIVLLSWLTPVVCSLGAVAPSFWLLVATQSVGRPLGIALALLAGVAAAEDMPRNSRAYAVSVLAMAAGLGAGVAVGALRLADIGGEGGEGWRLVYLISLVWLPIAVSLSRRLMETRRFETVHPISPHLNRRRLWLIAVVALTANLFVAPASFFQNRYLEDVRGYSGGGTALFTLATGTPASLGLILGGRLADVVGRRRLIIIFTPLSTACLVGAYFTGGAAMWLMALGGGFGGAMAYPALAVYRTELFPTGNRGTANGLVTATALLSGSLGILLVGFMRDRGHSFGVLIAAMGLGQLIAALIAYRYYPETAHLELEQLNPGDPAVTER
ncbi:MAG: MFS transporter [Actinomycetota bacterium]|nr:MFS transporter [Actinomycetota bacterium]